MAKYEAHITFSLGWATQVKEFAEEDKSFKYSAIDGDALMGDKQYCYLTAFDTDPFLLLRRCNTAGETLCVKSGACALRVKIEKILYDTKTDYNDMWMCD